MEKYNEFAGIVSEAELDEMCNEETAGGVISPATPGIFTIVTAITAAWSYCPTTGCTHECRFTH